MHQPVCSGARGRLIAQFNSEVEQLDQPLEPQPGGIGLSALNPERALLFSSPGRDDGLAHGDAHLVDADAGVRSGAGADRAPDPGYNGVVAEAREAHSPIGTSTPPVTAEAYAAPAVREVAGSPLAVDPTALPLRGRRGRPGHARRIARPRPGMRAAAEAPKTKVLAGGEGDGAADAPAPTTRGAGRAPRPRTGRKAAFAKGHCRRGQGAQGACRKGRGREGQGPPRTSPPRTKAKKPEGKKVESKKAAGAKGKPRIDASN